jgi:branched-chain amino acid transport system permease protein
LTAYWLSQLLNGLSFAMILYLIASGLTLTLGVMRVVNLTHGTFYLLGAYAALTMMRAVHSHIAGLLAAGVAGVAASLVVYLLIKRLRGDIVAQAILTFGLLFIASDAALIVWGGDIVVLAPPPQLAAAWKIGDFSYSSYRLFIIAVGVVIAGVLELIERRTLVGAMIRATVDDPEMAQAVGRDTAKIAALVFATGGLLAGMGGAFGGPVIGVYPGADLMVLLEALLVVIIGGLGSLTGSFLSALLVGILNTIGSATLPEIGGSLVFIVMLLLLAVRPTGLLGVRT